MKRTLLALFGLFGSTQLPLAADPLVQPNDRVAFCGDLAGGECTAFMEKYLLSCQNIPGLQMKQFGWSAPTAEAFLGRIDKDLAPWKPTVVTLQYNYTNDARPVDECIAAREKTQEQLIDALKKIGVRAIVLGSPACVDTLFGKDPAKAAAVNANLAKLAAADRDLAVKEGVAYAGVFPATSAMMAKVKAKLGADYNYSGGETFDPQMGCQLGIAYALLKAMNLNGDVGTITLHYTPDFVFDKAEATGDVTITSRTPTSLEGEIRRFTFWMPGQPVPNVLLSCLPFYDDLNSLKVFTPGLNAPGIRVYWNENSTFGNFTADEMRNGAQLPANIAWISGGSLEELDRNVHAQMEADAKAGRAAAAGTPDAAAEAESAAQLAKAKTWVGPRKFFLRVFPLAAPYPQAKPPPNVILDTDMASDVDDVGALALLNDFACTGECKLIGVVTNVGNLDSGATAHAINAYYGHGSVLVGSYLGEGARMTSILEPAPPAAYHGKPKGDGSHYTTAIHKQFDPDYPTDDKLPAGVDIYRKALADSPDQSVAIVSVGLMPNIQDLVQSRPDSVSPLSGLDLVRRKVRELDIMSNSVPQDVYLLSKWPTKIKWTTDAGNWIGTGQSLINTPENNPVRVAYSLFGDNPAEHNALKDSRASWDLTAAWMAVRGSGNLWDVLAGRPQSVNDFMQAPFAGHPNESSITVKMRVEDAAKIINVELARPPDGTLKQQP